YGSDTCLDLFIVLCRTEVPSRYPAARAHPNPDRPRGHSIHAYDVVEGRHAKNGRPLVEVSPGLPDGFRVDTEGNLWSSSRSGIQIFTPGGEKLGEIPVPEKVADRKSVV